jgi:hypothetical protein
MINLSGYSLKPNGITRAIQHWIAAKMSFVRDKYAALAWAWCDSGKMESSR